ncbi:MAG: DUF1592 domain-containing protein [Planctomycetaceae bacterium]|nr:DUF1592 domain-containing protein [Planctomycetaceae bacterium]
MRCWFTPPVTFPFLLAFLFVGSLLAEESTQRFLARHCADCHTGAEGEGGFSLEQLQREFHEAGMAQKWTRLLDRVAEGEMPPPSHASLSEQEQNQFVQSLGDWIRAKQRAEDAEHGRVRGRRLTNLQLERSLQDLLGIDIPLAVHFPEETRTEGYTTVADGQSMSHFQVEEHLKGVDRALEEAFRRGLSEKPDEFDKLLSGEALSRVDPKRRCREPEVIDGRGVVWSSGLIFYGRIPATTAREDGWYRFTIRAKALKIPEAQGGVWCTVRRGYCVSSAPLLAEIGSFEATDTPREWTFDAWLPRGEMLEIRPGDKTLKRANFAGGQVGAGEGDPQNVPGVAIESISMSRIHLGPNNVAVRQLLLGDLEVKTHRDWQRAEVKSLHPRQDAQVLVQRFAERAFRRPLTASETEPYLAFVEAALDQGDSFVNAIRGGYRALLCSPRFLFLQEHPGELDDFAIASRLAFFLWSRMPDEELLRLARAGELRRPATLREQVRRMLADERGRTFLKDFADQWLDLSEIDFTEPDPRLYPRFDPVVQQAMLAETQTFLQTLLEEDQSVLRLIDSDFTFLNSRLARYYEIAGVEGDELRRVSLTPGSPRGGLLGQGSILKVTANGTTTSPVIRGIWISERLLGQEIPEPPSAVPAIEPDIRGAQSIREQLAKHTSTESCNACHRHIDPPGFALENFDPAGQWRERYGSRAKKGIPIDPSHQFADGRKFKDIHEFRARALERPEAIARNVANHLLTYGTGASIRFADREVVDKIVANAADNDFGLRTLIEEVALSRIFLTK